MGRREAQKEEQGGRLVKLLQRTNQRLQKELAIREGIVHQDEGAMDTEHQRALVDPNTTDIRYSNSPSI